MPTYFCSKSLVSYNGQLTLFSVYLYNLENCRLWLRNILFGLICFFILSIDRTLPTIKIISGKNARAWVSVVSYLKKYMKIEILNREQKILEAIQQAIQHFSFYSFF